MLNVLYLIFNEGYAASSGPALQRVELSSEAIRLTRQLRSLLPDDGEVAGLLALMLLTDARRPARVRDDGSLVPLAEQDRMRWDRRAIEEGTALIGATLAEAPIGPYQLQAAIAAVHDEAPSTEDTDWRQILGLYELLGKVAPGPMVTLNGIVALAMVRGPEAGLAELERAEADPALAGHHRVDAVRAHLLEQIGRRGRCRRGVPARRTPHPEHPRAALPRGTCPRGDGQVGLIGEHAVEAGRVEHGVLRGCVTDVRGEERRFGPEGPGMDEEPGRVGVRHE